MTAVCDAPSVIAFTICSRGICPAVSIRSRAITGNTPRKISATLESSSTPSEMNRIGRIASGGTIETNVMNGENSERTRGSRPMFRPASSPASAEADPERDALQARPGIDEQHVIAALRIGLQRDPVDRVRHLPEARQQLVVRVFGEPLVREKEV